MSCRSFVCFTALWLAGSPRATVPLLAQGVPAADTVAQPASTRDAHADGRRAAEERWVGGRLLGGALAGVPLGFFGSLTLIAGPQPEIIVAAAVGGGALLLARRPGDTAPPGPLAALIGAALMAAIFLGGDYT